MGRCYAGILGLVAFLAGIARGWISGASNEQTLLAAWLSLITMTAIGCLLGRVAQWIIDDCVRAQIAAQLADQPPTASEASSPAG